MTRKGGGLMTVEIVDKNGGVLWSFLRDGLAHKPVFDAIKTLRDQGWKIGKQIVVNGVLAWDGSAKEIREGDVLQIPVSSVVDERGLTGQKERL